MPNRKKSWLDYPPQYATLAKSVATATLPALYGPKPRSEALAFRRSFYRFRESLGESASVNYDSYPSRLYRMIQSLSVKIEPNIDDPSMYNIIFYLDPIVEEVNEHIDPQAAQIDAITKANFVAANRPPPISKPIFSPDELRDRIDETRDGGKKS